MWFHYIQTTKTTVCAVKHLCSNVQMNHKVSARCRPEEKVEVAACQPQRAAAAFGCQDVAVGRNRTLDPKHWTLQRLVLASFINTLPSVNSSVILDQYKVILQLPCTLTRRPALQTFSILQL